MKGTIRSLGKRLAALQTQLDNLHSTRSTLKLRGTILNAWCEGLNLMRGAEVCRHAVCGNWSDSSEQLEQLLQEEFQLLEQLGDGIAEVGEVPSLAAQTMAPAAEPMAFLQQLLSCPLPSVAAADNMAFAVVYRDAVQEGGMLLHALQAVPASSRPAILEHMQQLWNRYALMVLAQTLNGEPTKQMGILLLELRTMQPAAEAAHQHAARMIEWVPWLGLSDSQVHVIAQGAELASTIMTGMQRQRHDLQQQITELDNASGTSTPTSSSETASSGNPGGTTEQGSSSTLQSMQERQQHLEQQQRQLARLKQLLKKEVMFRFVVMMWMTSCMSVEQLTKAAVMSWPYHLRWLVLLQAIKDYRHQQQQQQPQRQRR